MNLLKSYLRPEIYRILNIDIKNKDIELIKSYLLQLVIKELDEEFKSLNISYSNLSIELNKIETKYELQYYSNHNISAPSGFNLESLTHVSDSFIVKNKVEINSFLLENGLILNKKEFSGNFSQKQIDKCLKQMFFYELEKEFCLRVERENPFYKILLFLSYNTFINDSSSLEPFIPIRNIDKYEEFMYIEHSPYLDSFVHSINHRGILYGPSIKTTKIVERYFENGISQSISSNDIFTFIQEYIASLDRELMLDFIPEDNLNDFISYINSLHEIIVRNNNENLYSEVLKKV